MLSTKSATLYLDAEEVLPQELQNEKPRLALLGTQLFVAMPGQERLAGWLALGPPETGNRYTSQEIDVLIRLAELSAAAVERAQVMADKDRRVHEMNVLTRVAQGVNITVEFDDILELLYAQSTQVIPVENFNITLYNSGPHKSSGMPSWYMKMTVWTTRKMRSSRWAMGWSVKFWKPAAR